MRITYIFAVLAVTVLLALPAAGVAAEPPPRPAVFGGTAVLNGSPAPDGTAVTALINGVEVAATVVENGAYAFIIPQPTDESYAGETVTFLVAGVAATQTGIWEADGGGELNLSADGDPPPQVVTSQPAPDSTVPQPQPAGQNGPMRRAFVGVVDGEPGDTVTVIQKGNRGSVTIALGSHKVKTPGGPVASAFGDGAQVVVQARHDNGNWIAVRVLVKPVKPTLTPVNGTIIAVDDGVITVMQANGATHEIELDQGATPPKIGDMVTGFAGANGDNKATGRSLNAKGLVKASKIRERLEGFLQDLTAEQSGVLQGVDETKVTAAQEKANAAREKAEAARAEADAALAKAEAAQGAEAADLKEQAADAVEEADEAEAELAEAEDEVAEAEAETAAEAAEAKAEATERRAERVADVASILNELTTRHTDVLRSLADGNKLPEEAIQGIATALENAQRGRSQANLKATEARAKAEDKREQALAKAEEKREEALARADEKRVKALARAEEKKEKALAKAEKKREKASAKADEEKQNELAKAEEEKQRELAKAEKEKGKALAKADEEKGGRPDSTGRPEDGQSNGKANSNGKGRGK